MSFQYLAGLILMRGLLIIFFIALPFVSASARINLQLDSLQINRSDSLVTSDSLHTIDDSLTTPHYRILKSKGFFSDSFYLDSLTLLKNDYRSAEDYFSGSEFYFKRSLGFIGQPDEIFIKGAGNSEISFLENGILLNNRFNNFFNLNFVQTESVDSVEIIPMARSFLAGLDNNYISVNLIKKDFVLRAPYSRIKYYEGPFGEAFIDVLFSMKIHDRIAFSFDAENRKFDEGYENTDYSVWLANSKLKYFLSREINLAAEYSYAKSSTGLNGGVDVDAILSSSRSLDSLLYNEISAPVRFTDRYLKSKQHNFNLKGMYEHSSSSEMEFSLYYKFSLDEYRQNESLPDTAEKIFVDNKFKTAGAAFKQRLDLDWILANLDALYENSTFSADGDFINNYKLQTFSLSGFASLKLLNGMLRPAAFAKYISRDNKNKFGFGTDLNLILSDKLKFYAGYSVYERLRQPDQVHNYEAGSKINLGNLKLFISGFIRVNDFSRTIIDPFDYRIPFYDSSSVLTQNTYGVSGKLNFNVSKIFIRSDLSLYKFENRSAGCEKFPALNFTADVFYQDSLFNSHLDLKTGFLFRYKGKQTYNLSPAMAVEVPEAFQIDFYLTGDIGGDARVYFTWENLLDEEYYVVPYYPMLGRNIRFGIAWEFLN